MDNLLAILEDLGLKTNLALEDIPELDLYMDQVIQLFEKKFAETKRNEEDKVLTKTMINNYAKGKLLFPIHNKKYTKEHLIIISLIYHLKGALSISDIKSTLDGINRKAAKDEIDLDAFYQCFLNLTKKNVENFYKDIERQMNEVGEEESSAELEQILMIASLVHMSSLYRRTAEKLVDRLSQEKGQSVNKGDL